MKRLLLVSILLILSLSCWHFKGSHVELSTPEKTLKTYYEAFKASDFEYQKKTVVNWIEDLAEERFNVVSPILQTYEIIQMREAKDRKDDTFHLPEDDVDILVKEVSQSGEQSLTSYVLREFDGKWLIYGFDAVEDPPGGKVIDEQAKKMFKEKSR